MLSWNLFFVASVVLKKKGEKKFPCTDGRRIHQRRRAEQIIVFDVKFEKGMTSARSRASVYPANGCTHPIVDVSGDITKNALVFEKKFSLYCTDALGPRIISLVVKNSYMIDTLRILRIKVCTSHMYLVRTYLLLLLFRTASKRSRAHPARCTSRRRFDLSQRNTFLATALLAISMRATVRVSVRLSRIRPGRQKFSRINHHT